MGDYSLLLFTLNCQLDVDSMKTKRRKPIQGVWVLYLEGLLDAQAGILLQSCFTLSCPFLLF